MNKEKLTRQLEYTRRKHEGCKLYTFDTDVSAMCKDTLDVLNRCVEISEWATNGSAVMSLYPNLKYTIQDNRVITTIGVAASFDLGWWNAPYGRDEE